MEPLFSADRARIDEGGVPAIDGLSCKTAGEHVIVLGAPRALAEAACGTRPVVHGALRVLGVEPVAALEAGEVAGATGDAPMPAKWTALELVTWSARLVGASRAAARGLAADAIARLELGAYANGPLGKATPIVRRATAIAAALATGARTIVLVDPLADLADDQARALGRILARALDDRAWMVFAPRVSLASPLALHADDALVLAGSTVVAQGAPAEIAARDRAYALRVHGDHAAFVRRVVERGARVEGEAHALVVSLGELSTRELLAIAIESNATILELRPLAAGLG